MEVCDRFRVTPEREAFWQQMMLERVPITEEEFLSTVDLKEILDDDESWEQYKQCSSDDINYYKSTCGCVFLQTCGFEFIFNLPKGL